ncbi:MAG: hypothetical protein KatS3mg044_0660 [Rhodothermaceae bacterium]|nr:MAG: hypothetical protein D6746_17435 [Bacteroidota bacterium]GIV61794.1 MAG: hypothetical protein KatS3mg044_0660 [Rhodothermaceae bacterium]
MFWKTAWRRWRQQRMARRVTPDVVRARVARGAAYLDAVDPGWHHRLDLATLTLADGTCCVLGQLHGEFRQGLFRTGILNAGSAPRASLSPVALGFQAVQGVAPELQERDYALLEAAWRAAIRQRRRSELHGAEDAPHGLVERFEALEASLDPLETP